MLVGGHGVRATLAGVKVMTRRPMRPQPSDFASQPWYLIQRPRHMVYLPSRKESAGMTPAIWNDGIKSTLGVPGDLLYVREACRAEEGPDGLDGVRYIADNAFIGIENNIGASDRWLDMYHYRRGMGQTVRSIHMPKWAARLWVRNTGVRVERGPEISEADALAEGFESAEEFMAWWANQYPGMDWRFVTEYEVTKR